MTLSHLRSEFARYVDIATNDVVAGSLLKHRRMAIYLRNSKIELILNARMYSESIL